MLRARVLVRLFCISVCSAAVPLIGQEAKQPYTQDQPPPLAQYEVVAKGIVASQTVRIQFKSAPLRVEVRNLVMGRGETESIPVPTRILFEVRQGDVTITLNREKQQRHQGDFWTVEKDSTLTIRNTGEVAVLRAMYIFEGSR